MISAEEKRAKRKLRHQLAGQVRSSFMRRMGMNSTTGTIHSSVKQWVNGQMAQLKKMRETATVGEIS
jgi:hypothetical protein